MNKAVIFISGVGLGSIVTYFVTKKICHDKAEAEIQSVKDAFKQIQEEERLALETQKEDAQNADKALKEYRGEGEEESSNDDNPDEESSNDDTDSKSDVKKGSLDALEAKVNKKHLEPKEGEPYCINPDDFGDGEYEIENLTYYSDGVLRYDDTGELVRHIDEVVGKENLYHFGEFEEDMLYVRDPVEMIDYSISLCDMPYHDRS